VARAAGRPLAQGSHPVPFAHEGDEAEDVEPAVLEKLGGHGVEEGGVWRQRVVLEDRGGGHPALDQPVLDLEVARGVAVLTGIVLIVALAIFLPMWDMVALMEN